MQPDEPPPFLGTWKRVYAFIVGYLVVVISLFAWFTHSYAP
jgi:hypothetical protein